MQCRTWTGEADIADESSVCRNQNGFSQRGFFFFNLSENLKHAPGVFFSIGLYLSHIPLHVCNVK